MKTSLRTAPHRLRLLVVPRVLVVALVATLRREVCFNALSPRVVGKPGSHSGRLNEALNPCVAALTTSLCTLLWRVLSQTKFL